MPNQELILIRGLPGSGKSTFADMLCRFRSDAGEYIEHFEADMWQYNADGVYDFKPERGSWTHKMCQETVWSALEAGCTVVVSNTFSRVKEMQPYLDMAEKLDIKCTVIEVQGYFGSIHNVPEETIQKMKDRWEKYPPEPKVMT